jgi:hypothetical protein
MRKAAVRHGDPTTTGGFVTAYSSSIHDGGKKIALSGDEATCGNCKGLFKMFGTGKGISQKSRSIVVDGDLVLCPCGKNRVIVGSNPRVFVNTHEGSVITSSASTAVTAGSSSLPTGMFDEQVRAAASIALDGYPFLIEMVDGRTFAGRVDASGKLPRIVTDDADEYIVYWGDQALARQDEA